MPSTPLLHPDEECLEKYALGMLDGPTLDEVEEHLLVCAACCERLETAEEYISIMREAVGRVEREEEQVPAWKRWVPVSWIPQAPAMAAALLVVLAVAVWRPWTPAAPSGWSQVELEALRGPEAVREAKAGYAVRMRLDATGLPPGSVDGEVVGADRKLVCRETVAVQNDLVTMECNVAFAAGQYWVRLRSKGELLREYALLVR